MPWALAFVAAVIALIVGAVLWMTAVPGKSYEGPLPPLTAEQGELATRLRAHVSAIASVPHNVAHAEELERAASYIERELGKLGYEVQRQPFVADGVEVRNLHVVVEPQSTDAKTLVVGAHYDSAFNAPGANDNGTGAAAVIELARLLSDVRRKSALRLRLVLFVNEEPPYFKSDAMGSFVYAKEMKRRGEPLWGMLSLETLGFYSNEDHSQRYPPPLGLLYPTKGNFIAFVGLTSSRSFVRSTVRAFRSVAQFPSVGGTAPAAIPGIDWSDHWSFEQIGVPSLMVTDTAPFRYPHYHTPEDTPDKVDYDGLARVVWDLERVVRAWALENQGRDAS
jgi:hypothetical protein